MALPPRKSMLATVLLAMSAAAMRQGLEHEGRGGVKEADLGVYIPGGAVPGGLSGKPRPAIDTKHAGPRFGLPPQRPARATLPANMQPPMAGWGYQGPFPYEPLGVPLKVTAIINKWIEESNILELYDESASWLMKRFRETLGIMRSYIDAGTPVSVLALTKTTLASDVQAIAVVKSQALPDDFGELAYLAKEQGLEPAGGPASGGGRVDTITILSLAASPAPGRDSGLGPEFIHKIAAWAAARGCLVTAETGRNPLYESTYKRLGFRMLTSDDRYMVLHGTPAESGDTQNFHMVKLEP